MKLTARILPAVLLTLLCLAPAIGRAPSLVPGAAAYTTVNNWDTGESEDTPAARFLRAHFKHICYGLAIVFFVVFSVLIGPTGRSYRRGSFGRGCGFGPPGGFGGAISTKNPWA